MAAPDDLVPGTEVQSQALDNNFNELDGRITSLKRTVDGHVAKFVASTGHKHTGASGDGPRILHSALDMTGVGDEAHPNYVLMDGSRAMTALTVAGLAIARQMTVQPLADLGATPILYVKDHAGAGILEVVANGGTQYVNLPTGTYRSAGVKLKSLMHVTFCFDSITALSQQRKVRLPGPLGGAEVVHLGGYVGSVGAGADLQVGVYKETGGSPTQIESNLTFTLSTSNAVDDFAVSPAVALVVNDYIVVKVNAYTATCSNVVITVSLLVDYR